MWTWKPRRPSSCPSEFAMVLKLSKNLDDVRYPVLRDTSYLCGFEVVPDGLCALIGGALAYLPDDMPDLRADLEHLQPLAFHGNGSVRGRLAVEEADIAWLSARLAHYREEVAERLKGFVLPRGLPPVPQLHQARS